MKTPNPTTEALVTKDQVTGRLSELLWMALEEAKSLSHENEQLRLAICGGEDAPGYASSVPLDAILGVQAENEAAHREQIDENQTLTALLKEAEGVLEPVSALASVPPFLAGLGENSQRTPEDIERYHHGHLITWGLLRRIATLHAKLTAQLDGEG